MYVHSTLAIIFQGGECQAALQAATSAVALFLAFSSIPSLAQEGFTISYDGKRIAGDAVVSNDADAAAVDAELAQADVQVKFDGLDVKPILNVATRDLRRTYKPARPCTSCPAQITPTGLRQQKSGFSRCQTTLALL